MTEPGTSLLGKTVPSLLPFLTSGSTWSVGMKSCTGRSPGLGCGVGRRHCSRHSSGWHRPLRALAGLSLSSSPSAFFTQLRSAVGKQGAAERPGQVPHTDSAAHGQQVRPPRVARSAGAASGVRCSLRLHGEQGSWEEGRLEPSQQDILCLAVTPDFVPAPHV